MKIYIKRFLMIVFVAIIGFFMAACGDDPAGSGTSNGGGSGEELTYSLTYVVNGGAIAGYYVFDDEFITWALPENQFFKPPNPTKTFYTFDEWYEDSSFTIPAVFPIIAANDVTLYAKWALNKYTVTFDSKGGSAVSSITNVEHGSKISKPGANPTKTTGAATIFDNWYSNEALTIEFDFANTEIVGNTTIYAKWEFPHKLGDTVPGQGGGKIFYRSDEGFNVLSIGTCHYLEAAPVDQGSALTWASSGVDDVNMYTTSTTLIGEGMYNTISAVLTRDTTAPAFLACKNYSNNGRADWFLPNRNELQQLYQNKSFVGNLSEGYYWSSTQGNFYNTAYSLNFSTGAWNTGAKTGTWNVRAIRAF